MVREEKKMDEQHTPTKIDNIVITCKVGITVDLVDLADLWWMIGVQMNSLRFPNLVVPIRKPKCTVLVFASGKIVVEGCKYIKEGEYVLRVVCQMLRDAGYPEARCTEMIIQNVVANRRLAFGINLQALATELGEYCVVKPTFPGAGLKGLDPLRGNTGIAFWTGSLVITGGVNTRQIREVSDAMIDFLRRYRLLEGETKESVLAKCKMPYQNKKMGNRRHVRVHPYRMGKGKGSRAGPPSDSEDSDGGGIPLPSELRTEPNRILFE